VSRGFRGSKAWAQLVTYVKATQDHCHLCGGYVDVSVELGHDASPEVDHIIPVARGGHPLDKNNVALAHRICNRRKGKKMGREVEQPAIVPGKTYDRGRRRPSWQE